MAHSAREYLTRLRDVILLERGYAKELDIKKMEEVMMEKEELIQILSHYTELHPEDQDIATQIRHENRRNAYMFKSTLGWIRDTMEFFGKRTVTSTYSASAGTVSSQVNGRLLSGRI